MNIFIGSTLARGVLVISANVYASAYASIILVNSQMCQSWCHEILVTAPEMQEEISISLYLFSSLLLNWPMLEICNVLCTSHCVIFIGFLLSQNRSLGRCF